MQSLPNKVESKSNRSYNQKTPPKIPGHKTNCTKRKNRPRGGGGNVVQVRSQHHMAQYCTHRTQTWNGRPPGRTCCQLHAYCAQWFWYWQHRLAGRRYCVSSIFGCAELETGAMGAKDREIVSADHDGLVMPTCRMNSNPKRTSRAISISIRCRVSADVTDIQRYTIISTFRQDVSVIR